MNDLFQMIEEETDAQTSSLENVDQKGLKQVSALARAVLEKQASVARAEAHLKEEKKALLQLTDFDLPDSLSDLGMTAFTLADGSEIRVKPLYAAFIAEADRPEAFGWLRENGYEDLIKNQVSCQFGMGEDEQAVAFIESAEKAGYPAEQKTSVHPATLKAWIKERMENGDEFPTELFNAYTGFRATIKKGV